MARPYLGGKTIVLDGSVELNITMTLPATTTSKGVLLDFVIGTASHAATEILITSDTNIVGGLILNSTGAVTSVASGASRGFGNASVVGSRMQIVCDGSQWLILNATSSVAFVTAF